MTQHKQELVEFLLRLGDNALIGGQRLCEWCGRAPALEEELALMNIGLDLVGQARNWYEHAARLLDDGRDADQLAFRRSEREYRNLLLVEQPNGDYAVTTLRLFLFDAWHLPLLEGLQHSSDPQVAGIAAKAVKEVRYHLQRSSEWVIRLGDGTEESRQRMLAAIDQLWRFTVELQGADPLEQRLHAAGLIPDLDAVGQRWQQQVSQVLEHATLPCPAAAVPFYLDGRQGLHSEHLGLLLAEMQYLQRAYPDAVW